MFERQTELDALARARAAAVGGEGGVVLIEGSAGIGKTALLHAARAEAEHAGMLTRFATAWELERGFPFGVLHQLLDPVLARADEASRARLLAGAARHAETALSPGPVTGAGEDLDYTVLHGLYWLAANLADAGPVALLVDDLHWADRPSLRAIEYIGRRLEGLRVLLVATARPGEPGADHALLEALASGPSARVLRPAPLSAEGAAAVVAGSLDAEPAGAFVAASLAATGGNPLLLRLLADEAAREGLRGTDDDAARVPSMGAGDLARLVRRRLDALGTDAVAVAQAAAVLGDRGRLEDLAAIAGLDVAAALAAADRLAATELLEPGGCAFVHPLVREAVAGGLSALERARLHTAAAERLRAAGGRPEEIAVHLLGTPPAGDPEVVAALRAAARAAAAGGAPEVGIAPLRRALDEPPRPGDRAAVLLELGELETRVGDAEALDHLGAALAAGLTGDDAARAHAARGTVRLLTDPEPALEEFERALADALDPDLRLRLEALVLEASVFDRRSVARREQLLAAGRVDAHGSPVMLAHLAQDAAYRGTSAAATVRLAEQSLAAGLMEDIGPISSTYNLLVHALRYAEHADRARRLLDEGEAIAQRRGLRFAAAYIDHAWAYWHLSFGSVGIGTAHAQTGLANVERIGYAVTVAAFAAVVAELLLESDRIDEAAAVLEPVAPAIEETIVGPLLLAARGAIRRAQLQRHQAETDLRRAVELLDERGWHAPMVGSARTRLAEVLAEGGGRDEAAALLDAAEATAATAGTPGAQGCVLRSRSRLLDGDAAIEALQQSTHLLAGSPLRLEHGWALHDLGAALRRAGRRADAREPLRAAIDTATRLEAAALARMARDELAATGARPRRRALSGPAALTPSERRVAELAAAGRSNREIAETLWVTRRTVEVHLGNTFRKLGIRSRTQLADTIGGAGTAVAP